MHQELDCWEVQPSIAYCETPNLVLSDPPLVCCCPLPPTPLHRNASIVLCSIQPPFTRVLSGVAVCISNNDWPRLQLQHKKFISPGGCNSMLFLSHYSGKTSPGAKWSRALIILERGSNRGRGSIEIWSCLLLLFECLVRFALLGLEALLVPRDWYGSTNVSSSCRPARAVMPESAAAS